MPIYKGEKDKQPTESTMSDAIKSARKHWDKLDDADREQATYIIDNIVREGSESPEYVRGAINMLGKVVEYNYEARQMMDEMDMAHKYGLLTQYLWQNCMYALILNPYAQAIMARMEGQEGDGR